jgi:hypothetical protein
LLSPLGLGKPKLNALLPTEDNYSCRLLQPEGEIEANPTGVYNRNAQRARAQYGAFLRDACEARNDLVMTPEYCLPWSVLEDAIRGNIQPSLWALGCESLTYADLSALKERLTDICEVRQPAGLATSASQRKETPDATGRDVA